MGRSIPSISYRLDEKMRQWERFAKLLPKEEQEAFTSLIPLIRNRRSAIDGADESDIGVAILLAIIVQMRGEIDVLKRGGKKYRVTEGRAQDRAGCRSEDRSEDRSKDRDEVP